MCCMLHKHILNGRMFNDMGGDFTYFANDGCPVVDHMIASSKDKVHEGSKSALVQKCMFL